MELTREGNRDKTKARHPSEVTRWRKVRQVRPRWEMSRAVGREERIMRMISWGRSVRFRLGLLWFGAVIVDVARVARVARGVDGRWWLLIESSWIENF